jgi:thioredoxin 1
MSSAIEVTTASWDSEVASADVPVVVDFWAPWCGPCRMVAPVIDELSTRFGTAVKFVKVNIDDNGELAQRFGVMSIPTIAKFEQGKMAAQVVGARGADALAKELGIA